jgi:hypothetical protein
VPPGRRNHAVRGERRLSGWRQSQHAKLQRSPSFSLPHTANITRSPPDPLAAQPHRDADLLPDHQAHSPFPRTSHPLLTPAQLANRVRSTSPACPHHRPDTLQHASRTESEVWLRSRRTNTENTQEATVLRRQQTPPRQHTQASHHPALPTHPATQSHPCHSHRAP